MPKGTAPTCTGVAVAPNSTSASPGTPGVPMSGGANMHAFLNAYPAGTTFCFANGTYNISGDILPKAAQRLVAVTPRQVIFHGGGGGACIKGSSGTAQQGVVLQGLAVTGVVTANTMPYDTAVQCGTDWSVLNCDIHHNSQVGLVTNSGSVIRNNYVHHNGRYGVTGSGNSTTPATDILLYGNEIAFNNTAQYWNGNAGGTKFLRCSRLVFQLNKVHDNTGAGIHCDTGVYDVLYEGNVVTANWAAGIQHEASGLAIVRSNTLTGNCFGFARGQVLGGGTAQGAGGLVVGTNDPRSLGFGADIVVRNSRNVEIHNNTVVAGVHGLDIKDDAEAGNVTNLDGNPAVASPALIRNIHVHDNDFTLPEFPGEAVPAGRVGMVGARAAAYASANLVRFLTNHYHVTNTAAKHWQWGPSGNSIEKDWQAWRAAVPGEDLRDAGGTLD